MRQAERHSKPAAGVVATVAGATAFVAVTTLLAFAAFAADAPPAPAAAKPSVVKPGASIYSAKGADTCLGCHSTPNIVGIFRTKHAEPNDDRGPFGHGGLQCEACHGPGGAHVAAGGGPPAGMIVFGAKSVTPIAQQNANCLGCHQSNAAHDWAASAHAANDVACASCHSAHKAKDPMSEAATQIDVCVGCHQTQRAALFKPSHHPLREGKMSCTSCHSPHGSSAPAALVKNTITETCTSCHAELRGPFLWEHQPVAENCANCHEPHGSTQPAMLIMRPPFLCQTCHDGAGHPSIANTPAGLAGGKSPSSFLVGSGCVNCHSQVHGSNHPSGRALMR